MSEDLILTSKFDPRFIGGDPRGNLYYWVHEYSTPKTWYSTRKIEDLFPIIEKDQENYQHKIVIYKIFKKRYYSSFYALLKIYDNTFDFIEPQLAEYMKAILTLQNLPPEEYERKIKELVRILGL